MNGDQGYTYLRTYRYERKFLVEDLQPFQVAGLIHQHPRMFRAAYPPRFVNNLYLDTPELENYYDNVHGAARRCKVRLRWYGEPGSDPYGSLFGEIGFPMLEIKLKDGLVGTKRTYSLCSFRLDKSFNDEVLQHTLANSDLPPLVRQNLRGMSVVLFNRYNRQYYASRDGAFRLTVDTRLEYYRVNGRFANQFAHRQAASSAVVVELKYEIEQEPQAERVAGYFPFRLTRISKYVQGIERVYF